MSCIKFVYNFLLWESSQMHNNNIIYMQTNGTRQVMEFMYLLYNVLNL
jgi:hypothetical protein